MARLTRRLFCAAVALAALVAPATAAEWPDRPITMIIMSKQGGGMDLASRLVGEALAEQLGQPMKYVNRPGASGEIALRTYLESRADGYTLFSGNISTLMMMAGLRGLETEVDDQLSWLGAYLVDPALLVTPAASLHENLGAFIGAAKETPMRVGVANWASVQTLALLQLRDATGAQIEIIPYSGFKGAATALLGNHIEAGVGNFSATEKLGDDIRYLGIFAESAPGGDSEVAPIGKVLEIDVIDAASVRGLAVHERLKSEHPDRYERLHDAFETVISEPSFQESFKSIGADPSQAVEWGETEADAFGKAILDQLDSFREMFEKSG